MTLGWLLSLLPFDLVLPYFAGRVRPEKQTQGKEEVKRD